MFTLYFFLQTKDERVKRNLMKEKRDNLMAARLKKIKDRQRAKMGLPPEPEIEEEPSPGEDELENDCQVYDNQKEKKIV